METDEKQEIAEKKEEEIDEEIEDLEKLKRKLRRKVVSRGFDANEEDIYDEIKDAIEFVNNKRSFVATPECLYEKKFSSIIIDLALSAIAKYGAEGETSHSENGISRGYENGSSYPESITRRIPPLAISPD